MTASQGHTLAENEEPKALASKEQSGAYLFVLLECERPRAYGARHSLIGLRTVTVGRASERRSTRAAPGLNASGVDLDLRFPDGRMSSSHARLTQLRGQWVLEDTGSRNGTRVNGDFIEQKRLQDGDVLEMGRTLFLFRGDLPETPLPDLDADALDEPPLTLHPSLEVEFERLKRIATAGGLSILIEGESGTGKEVLARTVANWSGRGGNFVGVNCGALPDNLIESELFGSTRGAFSGAIDRQGFVRSADKGCLFLDEIAELPLPAQASLLRVLEEHEVVPLGATRPHHVDVQVVAATHQDLEQRVSSGKFRQDLFARISGFRTRLPPLRERMEDLGLIIGTLLDRDPQASPTIRFTSEGMRTLLTYSWPLNIREFAHALRAAVLLATEDLIEPQHLPAEVTSPSALGQEPALTESQLEQREQLLSLLKKHQGNVSAIARELGKARMQVQRWLKRFDIDAESYRDSKDV